MFADQGRELHNAEGMTPKSVSLPRTQAAMTSQECKFLVQAMKESPLRASQREVAEMLGVSSTLLNNWVTGKNEKIHEEYARTLNGFVAAVAPDKALDLDKYQPLLTSKEYSWDATTFKRLKAETKKRCARVTLRAFVGPPKPKQRDFADAQFEIEFSGLELNGEQLRLDHVGNAHGPDGKPQPFDLVYERTSPPTPKISPPGARVERDDRVRKELGEHALAYMLDADGRYGPVTLHLCAPNGAKTNAVEAIGYPVYPDFLIDELVLIVEFIGYVPDPRPGAQAYLIRRTSYIPSGVRDDFKWSVRRLTNQPHCYAFGALVRPKPFFYCLTWESLRIGKA